MKTCMRHSPCHRVHPSTPSSHEALVAQRKRRAAEIRVPVLLMHGANDATVPVEQSRDMAEALQKAGRTDVRYVELPLGDHALSRQQDREQFLTEVEQFLRKNLD